MKQQSILIVDDEPMNFDVIEALLEHQGYQLHYAATGYRAIESLNIFQPDLILLDVMMPGINGIEVCQKIKVHPQWKVIPIIMVTALSSKTDLARCLEAGADDFISKPVNAIELRARVHSMCRIKQQYDNIQALSHVQKNTIQLLERTLDTLQGNLASTLGHELNTPLNGILGTIGLLNMSADKMEIAEVQEMLGWVDASARRLECLTQKFRTYLEIELLASQNQLLQAAQTPFPSLQLESELITLAERADRTNDITLTLEKAVLSLPESYLVIIFHELLDNALKFSSPNTMIDISSSAEKQMLHIFVHDLGRGMTEEQVTQVGAFMQFERNLYEQQGTGMGLRIVKRIVELAGGHFSISSVYQKETTIHLTLPICPD